MTIIFGSKDVVSGKVENIFQGLFLQVLFIYAIQPLQFSFDGYAVKYVTRSLNSPSFINIMAMRCKGVNNSIEFIKYTIIFRVFERFPSSIHHYFAVSFHNIGPLSCKLAFAFAVAPYLPLSTMQGVALVDNPLNIHIVPACAFFVTRGNIVDAALRGGQVAADPLTMPVTEVDTINGLIKLAGFVSHVTPLKKVKGVMRAGSREFIPTVQHLQYQPPLNTGFTEMVDIVKDKKFPDIEQAVVIPKLNIKLSKDLHGEFCERPGSSGSHGLCLLFAFDVVILADTIFAMIKTLSRININKRVKNTRTFLAATATHLHCQNLSIKNSFHDFLPCLVNLVFVPIGI